MLTVVREACYEQNVKIPNFSPLRSFASRSVILSRRNTVVRCAALIFALAAALSAPAASIDSRFHSPELADLAVPQRLLVLPDDSFLVYWNFNRFNGRNAGLVLKFKADRTLDPGFRVDGNFFHVIALTPAPGGKFIASMRYQDKTGARYPIFRLNGDGSIDPSFNAGAGADRDVYGLAVQDDGKILVGGIFSSFNGQTRQGIVRLQPNGALDTGFAAVTFDPDQTSGSPGIRSNIIVQPDGKILIAGNFSGVNGTSRNGIARLDPDGTLDSTFVPTAVRSGTGGHQPIGAIALQPDGKILAAGRFAPVGSNMISPLVRMSSQGAVEHYFPGRINQTSPPTTRPFGRALKLLPNGDTIVAGDRLYLYSAAGTERTGSQANTVAGVAFGLDTTSDGRILLAGDRLYLANGVNVGVQRFSPEGVRDTSFNVGEFQREVLPQSFAVHTDGRIWLAHGLIRRVDGLPRRGAARLNRDGTLDPSAPSLDTFASGISLQSDDRVVLFGSSYYRRFNADDSEDPTFAHDTTLAPFTSLQPALEGRHFVLAYTASAVPEDTVIRQIKNDGIINLSFRFGIKFSEAAMSDDQSVVYLGDNKPMAIYTDGRFMFSYFDKTGNYRLARFNSDGSLDPTFQTASVLTVAKDEYMDPAIQKLVINAERSALTDVLLLPDGKMIAVGMFKQFNGAAAPGIVRLDANGSIDATFNPGRGAGWVSTPASERQLPRVDAIERLPNGQLLVTGDFEAFDGAAVPGIARLNSDGSLDRTFVSPVVRQAESTTPFEFVISPISHLVTEPSGTILLSGNYAPAGGGPTRSVMRLKGLTDTVPLNISTRLNVQTGENVMIGGFIISGNAPKKVIIRALGTSLVQAGVVGALLDPMLELHGTAGVIATNDNWRQSQQAEIEASGVPPQAELESAIVATLNPGSYTAIVRGKNDTTGIGLVEAYDLDQASDSQLANISTRGMVQTGENVMIGGFILGGSGSSTNILVRALGPSLNTAGVTGALQDPTLELRDRNGNLLMENDDWKSTQRAAIEASTIPPPRDEEAALVATLPAGAYTAIVRGKNSTSGVGLVEVFNLQ